MESLAECVNEPVIKKRLDILLRYMKETGSGYVPEEDAEFLRILYRRFSYQNSIHSTNSECKLRKGDIASILIENNLFVFEDAHGFRIHKMTPKELAGSLIKCGFINFKTALHENLGDCWGKGKDNELDAEIESLTKRSLRTYVEYDPLTDQYDGRYTDFAEWAGEMKAKYNL